jgi:3-dehydroquinate dehydratase type I
MICVSVAEQTPAACRTALEGLEFAEIRLDAMTATLKEIHDLFTLPLRQIATHRPGMKNDDRRKIELLTAIEAGAVYVDIEIESPQEYREELLESARASGCEVIISFHDERRTPPKGELTAIVDRCFSLGADLVKVACNSSGPGDNARLLSLYELGKPLVAFGMGRAGRWTRIAAPLLGAPFTYAALSRGRETAPGQLDHHTLRQALNLLTHGTV